MEATELFVEEENAQKFKGFFRMGFYVESEKIKNSSRSKPIYLFDVYREREYIGSVECEAKTLMLAKKELDKWLLNCIPVDDLNFAAPYINLYRYNMDNYKVRINYVNKIIRDREEDMY